MRLKRGFFGLTPVEPDGKPLTNPDTGNKLDWSLKDGLRDPKTGREFRVELKTGWLAKR